MWAEPSQAGTGEPRHSPLRSTEFGTGWIQRQLSGFKMMCLWILKSGIHCLSVLMLSVFFLAARGDLSAPTALPFSGVTLNITETFTSPERIPSAKTPAAITSSSNGTRPTSKLGVPGAANMTGTTLGGDSRVTTISPVLRPITNGTRPSNSSDVSTAPVSTTVTTGANISTSTGANISTPETTASEPGRTPLRFWAILLICLTMASVFIGVSIGCCFLYKKNII